MHFSMGLLGIEVICRLIHLKDVIICTRFVSLILVIITSRVLANAILTEEIAFSSWIGLLLFFKYFMIP